MHRIPAGGLTPDGDLRWAGRSWMLAGMAVLIGVGFIIAPAALAGGGHGLVFYDNSDLRNSVRDNFIQYWHSGERSAGMNDLVDYWLRYHIVKAAFAALLTAVLALLAVRLWKRATHEIGPGRLPRTISVAGAAAALLGVGAAVLTMANVQGAIAPLSSLLSLLPPVGQDTGLGTVEAQASQDAHTGAGNPVVGDLIHDFAWYHGVLAAGAIALAAIGLTISALTLRSFAAGSQVQPRVRRAKLAVSITFALAAVAFLVLAVANAGSAANPGNALMLFFSGN